MAQKICFASIDIEKDLGTGEFRGVENLDEILGIFKKYEIPATLFVTGDVLEKYRDKTRQWSKDYEIACHSFTHRFWNTLNEGERQKELDDFINLYQQIFQKRPLGFRAPSHVIDEKGIGLLEKQGFLYDSSVLPHYPPFKKYRGYQGKRPLSPYYPAGLKILEIPARGQILGVPLAGAWILGLPFWFYWVLFFIYSPAFITLSMHSWDVLKPGFASKLEKIIKILKKKNYLFLNGQQLLQDRK
jgi:peptidoglycan/xylan/chitin deacetylase (PgdA/CDA1 family)